MPEEETAKKINPNTADLETLTELYGVGPALARRIQAARPFRDLEDLGKVAGMGEVTLERIGPRITFEAPPKKQAEPAEGAVPRSRQLVPVPKPSGRKDYLTRAETTTLLAVTALISVLLSVIVTLAIVAGINRTLDFGRHRAVSRLEGDVAALQVDVQAVADQLGTLDRRLQALDGVGGRLTSMETELGAVQSGVEGVSRQVEGVVTAVEGVAEQTRALSERANRFDAFLQGLTDLLGGLDGPAEADPGAGG